jgi:hypothetical protein
MGVCFMLVILKQFFLPNLKVATLLLCLTFVYGEGASRKCLERALWGGGGDEC